MQVLGVLETAIHVRDVNIAVEFYQRLFGFEILDRSEPFCAFSVGGRSVLLVFEKGSTNTPKVLSGGVIPPHEGGGVTHFAFSIPAEDLPRWEERLAAQGIAVEGRVTWPRGGKSIYFRDPDDHLVELVTPGLWAIY